MTLAALIDHLVVMAERASGEDRSALFEAVRRLRHGCNSYVRKLVNFTEFTESIRQLGLYWLVINVGATKSRSSQ